jgi:dTDP-4-dehydrorhamnose reductase
VTEMASHLVVGGNGLLGTVVRARLLVRNQTFLWTTRGALSQIDAIFLNLSDPIGSLPATEIVYLIAAIPKIYECESDPLTWVINVDAPIAIARQMAERGSFVVFVSSAAVEEAGHLAYARQKAQVESYINTINGAIVRPSYIAPDRAPHLANFMIDIGLSRIRGVYRWK